MRILPCLLLACAQAATAAATPLSSGEALQLKYDVEGDYRLQNGNRVRLSVVEGRLYLDLDRSYRKELHVVAPNLFASRDGLVTVQYLPDSATERIRIRHERYPAGRRIGEAHWLGY
jgi:hypothetical protein